MDIRMVQCGAGIVSGCKAKAPQVRSFYKIGNGATGSTPLFVELTRICDAAIEREPRANKRGGNRRQTRLENSRGAASAANLMRGNESPVSFWPLRNALRKRSISVLWQGAQGEARIAYIWYATQPSPQRNTARGRIGKLPAAAYQAKSGAALRGKARTVGLRKL